MKLIGMTLGEILIFLFIVMVVFSVGAKLLIDFIYNLFKGKK